jgi:hypothetical protein
METHKPPHENLSRHSPLFRAIFSSVVGDDPNISWQSAGVIVAACGVIIAIAVAWGDIRSTLSSVATEIEIIRARDSMYDADHDRIIRLEQDWMSNYQFQSNKPAANAAPKDFDGVLPRR